MFTRAFEKTAEEKIYTEEQFERMRKREDEAWHAVGHVLHSLPRHKKSDEFKRGDIVFYCGETGWKEGEDARHTKGGADADWDKDSIANGEEGVVTRVDKDRVYVRWNKHYYAPHSKMWEWPYRSSELRKSPRIPTADYEIEMHKEKLNPELKKEAVSRKWIHKHLLNGINKRFAMSRGMNHPKALAKAYTEKVMSHPTKDVVHQVAELVKKRKAVKDVY
jgi:hypothetical protein